MAKKLLDNILTLLVFLTCIGGFSYQSWLASRQYFNYKTISMIESREDTTIEFPSVTICAGQMLIVDQLSKCYDERSNKSKWDQHKCRLNKAHRIKPIIEFFDTTKVVPSVCHTYLNSIPRNLTNQYLTAHNCDQISPVQISLSFAQNKVCHTYFSHLEKGNKSSDWFRTKMEIISFDTQPRRFRMIAMIRSEFDSIFFKVHASNYIPEQVYGEELYLEKRKYYQVFVSKTVSHLLKAPYKTNCREYDIGIVNSEQSQEDCYQKCILDWYRKECSCLPNVQFPFTRRNIHDKDVVCDLYGDCYAPQIQSKASIMMEDCEKRCLPSCKSESYLFEFKTMLIEDPSNVFQIFHKPAPTLVFIHIPEITLIQFICNLASLAGMWMSFTIIGTMDKMKQMAFYFYDYHKLKKRSKRSSNLDNRNSLRLSHVQPIVFRRKMRKSRIPAQKIVLY